MAGGLIGEFLRHPLRTSAFVVKRVLEIPKRGLPRLPKYHTDEFDKRLGVDTARIVQIVATDSANARHGHKYETVAEPLIRWLIENSGIQFSDTVFIDFGCGKGRPMIVAASYPFKRVMGVEYSGELVAICRKNLAQLGIADRIHVVHGDAVELVIPGSPILAFFYNPFEAEVHRKVLANLGASGSPVVIAHVGPGHDVLRDLGAVEIAATTDAARLYRLKR